jgi:hypothetical protein
MTARANAMRAIVITPWLWCEDGIKQLMIILKMLKKTTKVMGKTISFGPIF